MKGTWLGSKTGTQISASFVPSATYPHAGRLDISMAALPPLTSQEEGSLKH